MNKFYVTTPIYYVNDIPHIGHAYTTIAADTLARYNRLKGRDVFFLTGTDEHGQKVERAAKEKGRTPQEHADIMVENFKTLWRKLNISNTAFIRTTDPEHKRAVQEILQKLRDKGEIEKRSYSGWYCTPDERFWTESEVVNPVRDESLNGVNANCPECGRPVEHIGEENYFFLMSRYQERLIKYIEDNPSYILPHTRRNEVLGFLKNNTLGDLCISRPKSRLSWGILLPFDEDFVTYVWFDALVNYYSATEYLAPENRTQNTDPPTHPSPSRGEGKGGGKTLNSELLTLNPNSWWPADHHLIGKDIVTTHAVYWSTMLMALGLPLPKNIFAHGWWTVQGKKMSKSLGNVVDPNEMIEKYGTDALRYFLFREVPFGLDGDFSEEALINRFNTDLANDLGNLLSRFTTMAEKYFKGFIEKPFTYSTGLKDFPRSCINACAGATDERNWTNLHFNLILDNIWDIIRTANNYIAQTEPWKLAENKPDDLKDVMFDIWNALRLTSLLLYPFMPETSEKMWKQLGLGADGKSVEKEVCEDWSKTRKKDNSSKFPEIFHWDWIPGYTVEVSKGEHLFPRVEKVKKI